MTVSNTLTLFFLVTEGEVGSTLTLDFNVISARGGGYPYESARDYFYRKQIEEVEERLAEYEASIRRAKRARKVKKPEIILDAVAEVADIIEAAPVREAVRDYRRQDIDWAGLQRIALAAIEDERRRIAVAKKRRRNADAIALLMAA